MAWTTIVLVSTGELATATVQNTHVLGNLNELRTGGIAIASQAAQDFLYASSATQLARLAAAGTTALPKSPTYTGSWAMSYPLGIFRQIVSATYSTEQSSTDTTYIDTGLTASITPVSTANKVLIVVAQAGVDKAAPNQVGVNLKLLRDSTDLITFGVRCGNNNTSGPNNVGGVPCVYVDSPASVSAVTYKTQFNSQNGSTGYVQAVSATSSIVLIEVVVP